MDFLEIGNRWQSKGNSRYGRQESRDPHCKFLFTIEKRVSSKEEHEVKVEFFLG